MKGCTRWYNAGLKRRWLPTSITTPCGHCNQTISLGSFFLFIFSFCQFVNLDFWTVAKAWRPVFRSYLRALVLILVTISELLHLEMLNSFNMLISFSKLNFSYIFSYTILLLQSLFSFSVIILHTQCSYCDLDVILFLVFLVFSSMTFFVLSSDFQQDWQGVWSSHFNDGWMWRYKSLLGDRSYLNFDDFIANCLIISFSYYLLS